MQHFLGASLARFNGSLLLQDTAFVHRFSFVPQDIFFSAIIAAKHGLEIRTFAAVYNEQCFLFNGFTLEITFTIRISFALYLL